ncbi:putative G antigen family E member 3 [Molossus molossus]|uniref:putative G antigen family E member 3 n=1 Tax=Molossus molossus TaxID=27622 RepID=UPI001747ACB1|nr:putative G antigen family E member 3 [Molossus molossus]XP_036127458.1 putative G antigen family E member 3 [Molossus molossus]
MSEQARPSSESKGGGDSQEFSKLVGPVAAQQPIDEQPQQEEPPTESQDITHVPEPEDARTLEVQGLVLEADHQELTMQQTWDRCGDGPDVMEQILSNLDPVTVPEAGEGQPYL